MADKKLSATIELTSLNLTDIFYGVQDPHGSPSGGHAPLSLLLNKLWLGVYETDADRDAAITSPIDGQMVFNQSAGAIQTYNSDFDAWVGWSATRLPHFVNVTPEFPALAIPQAYGCVYDEKLFCQYYGAYTDGVANYSAGQHGGLAQATIDQGILSYLTGKLYRSSDGISSYSEVISSCGGNLGSSVVDCGGGDLFYVEYGSDIFYSSDGGANWGNNSPNYDNGSPLITAHASAIDHFHGGAYDSTNGQLYLFTGDNPDSHASVLRCGDVASLISSPSTWTDRWGLDDATRSTLDTNYLLAYNSQQYRIISMFFSGDYGYCATDGITTRGLIVWRFHRTNYTIEDIYCWEPQIRPSTFINGSAAGVPWIIGDAPDGTVVIATASEYDSGYRQYCDKYLRWYAVLPDGRQAVEVYSTERQDSDSPSGILYPWLVGKLKDACVWTNEGFAPTVVGFLGTSGRIADSMSPVLKPYTAAASSNLEDTKLARMHSRPAVVNYCINGRFITDTTGWSATNSTISRETTIVDKGNVASLKVDPDTSGSSADARISLSTNTLNFVRGQMMTVAARIYLPATQQASQDPRLQIVHSGGSINAAMTSYFDGDWHEIHATTFIPEDCSWLQIRCVAHNSTLDPLHDPIYFSDVRLGVGTLALPEFTPPQLAIV